MIIYQLFAGYTPFNAASPYLTFLRIKRGSLVKRPIVSPPFLFDFLALLLEIDPVKRLGNALGNTPVVCYDSLRSHLFLAPLVNDIIAHNTASAVEGNQPQILSQSANFSAVKVPRLSEFCVRAVGTACIEAAGIIAENGGVKPETLWIKNLDLFGEKIGDQTRQRIAYYLHRKQRLHPPSIFRLLNKTLADTRCLRADYMSKEYIGHCRDLQVIPLNKFCIL